MTQTKVDMLFMEEHLTNKRKRHKSFTVSDIGSFL
jgi:hypothetical protein